MMRRRAVMRRGPGLVGTVARTAVIAGTATAVSGAMINHQQGKQQEAAAEAAAQQQAYQNQADLQAMQEQMAAMQAQQVQAAIPPAAPAPAPVAAPPPAPAVAPQTDIVAQLKQLGDLKAAGVLSDEEFQAAKAKLLAS